MIGSMSRKGNPYDNAVAESFFRLLKCEWVNHYRFASAQELYRSVYYYIEVFFMYFRPHQALGYKTPKYCERVRKLAV
jgi:putative transposase